MQIIRVHGSFQKTAIKVSSSESYDAGLQILKIFPAMVLIKLPMGTNGHSKNIVGGCYSYFIGLGPVFC